MPIPKIIHQIWFQGEENIPEHLKAYHKSWIDINPKFEVKVWDEKSIQEVLVKFNDKETTDMYNNYVYMIQKIDLAKYVILYMYGGIYIDMDVKCLKPITDEFLGDNDVILSEMVYNFIHAFTCSLIGHNPMEKIINNGVIMTVPKHPILLYTIEEAKKNKDSFYYNINKAVYVFSSTGPICLTLATKKFKAENESSKIKIIDETHFEACDLVQVNNEDCKFPEHAIGVHLYENSWLNTHDNIIVSIVSFIVKYRYLLIFLIVFLVFFFLVKPMKYFKKMKLFKFGKK
jgi:mannosyltransferase OCH1-like enzyme